MAPRSHEAGLQPSGLSRPGAARHRRVQRGGTNRLAADASGNAQPESEAGGVHAATAAGVAEGPHRNRGSQ